MNNTIAKDTRLELGFLNVQDIADTYRVNRNIITRMVSMGEIDPPRHKLEVVTETGVTIRFKSARLFWREEELPGIERAIKKSRLFPKAKLRGDGLPPQSKVRHDAEGNQLYGVKDLASLLNVSMSTMRLYRDSGVLPVEAAYVAPNNAHLWTKQEGNTIRQFFLDRNYYNKTKRETPDKL